MNRDEVGFCGEVEELCVVKLRVLIVDGRLCGHET